MVDKLSVKLYDSVSAVIAELVSNSYDADATEVQIEAPMGRCLATKAGGRIKDKNLEIRITDNGIGMTPREVNDYYLVVGSERRHDPRPGRGDKSPRFGRRVMGSKGIGKLAPFGICETVEIVSSGGNPVTCRGADGKPSEGYLTAHLILVRSAMLQDEEFDYQPAPGNLDQTVRPDTGTIIVLKGFGYRRVAAHAMFRRQLARRFGISSRDWTIRTRDTTPMQNDEGSQAVVEPFDIETMSNSRITFTGPERPNFVEDSDKPYQAQDASGHVLTEFGSGFHHDGRFYPVTGWTAYAKAPYKDELMAGIRTYCRNKIAAQTTVFGRGAGFPGEYSIRSCLVGEMHADWLDEAEDLIQTDRRDILWSHDLGQEFQRWGQKVVRKIGSLARDPLRQSTWQRFCAAGSVQHKIDEAFPAVDQSAIRAQATSLAKLLAQNLRPSEVEDTAVIEPMIQLTLTMAPHIELDQKLRAAANAEATPRAALGQILRMARMAEL